MNNHLILEDDDLSAGSIIKFPAYFKRRLKATVQSLTHTLGQSSDSGMQAALMVSTVASRFILLCLYGTLWSLAGVTTPWGIGGPLNDLPA